MNDKIHLTVEMPRHITLSTPNAKYLPDDKKTLDFDLSTLEDHDGVLSYIFQRGLDHQADTGALSKDEYPDNVKRAEAGYAFFTTRFENLAKGIVPKGGGGASLSPLVKELRLVVAGTFAKHGWQCNLKYTDIQSFTSAKPFAKVLVNAMAKEQKAKPDAETVDKKITGWIELWEGKVNEVIALRAKDMELEGDLTSF